MIGDMFVVRDTNGDDHYSHCTVNKTVIDYLQRVKADRPALVKIKAITITNAQDLAGYFMANHLPEVMSEPATLLLIQELVRYTNTSRATQLFDAAVKSYSKPVSNKKSLSESLSEVVVLLQDIAEKHK